MNAQITRGTVLLVLLACFLAKPESGNAQTDGGDGATLSLLPVTMEIGLESFDGFILPGATEDGASRVDVDPDDVPVIRFVTPTKILCFVEEKRRRLFEAKDNKSALETSVCFFGIGLRGIAGTRLVRGDWEAIVDRSEQVVTPRFKYRQSPIGFEVVLGGLSNIQPLWSFGVGAGANFYDLLISNDNEILLESSEISPFLYFVAAVDVVALTHMAFGGKFGELPVGLVLRYQSDLECGTDNCNVVDVSELPGGGSAHKPIFLRSQSYLLVISFPF